MTAIVEAEASQANASMRDERGSSSSADNHNREMRKIRSTKKGTIFPTLALSSLTNVDTSNGVGNTFTALDRSVGCDRELDNSQAQVPFLSNSPEPIQFETDLFRGRALVMIRSPNGALDDPLYYNEIFDGKKRLMEIQIQGQFRRKPKGIVYMGIEITEDMNPRLGLVTKGLCNVLLKFMKQFNDGIHYSYGDSKNIEYPHISFPLKDAEKLVVTKRSMHGSQSVDLSLPKLGEPLNEGRDDLVKRKNMTHLEYEFNTSDIYTIGFNTMYVDLTTWKVVNVPIMRNTDLATFWGKSSALRFVAYEIPEKLSPHGEQRHIQQNLKYMFCFQIVHDPNGGFDQNMDLLRTEDADNNRETPIEMDDNEVLTVASSSINSPMQEHEVIWNAMLPKESRAYRPMEYTGGISDKERKSNPDLPSNEDDLSNTVDHDIDDDDFGSEGYLSDENGDEGDERYDDDANESINENGTVYFDTLDEASQFGGHSSSSTAKWKGLDIPTAISTSDKCSLFPLDKLCPGWIDMCDASSSSSSSKPKYSRFHVFTISKDKVIFCTPSDFFAHLRRGQPVPLIDKSSSNRRHSPRLSHEERIRRRMGDVYSRFCYSWSINNGEEYSIAEQRIQYFQNKATDRFETSFMMRERNREQSLWMLRAKNKANDTVGDIIASSPRIASLSKDMDDTISTSTKSPFRKLLPSSSLSALKLPVNIVKGEGNKKDHSFHDFGDGFYLARAVCERHWVEQYATISTDIKDNNGDWGYVTFYHASAAAALNSTGLKKLVRTSKPCPTYRIPMESILRVEALGDCEDMTKTLSADSRRFLKSIGRVDVVPPHIPGFFFSLLETPGRVIYIMHPTRTQRSEWMRLIRQRIGIKYPQTHEEGRAAGSQQGDEHQRDDSDIFDDDDTSSSSSCVIAPFFRADYYYATDDPAQEYMHKSSLWNCKNRRILNCRRFIFTASPDFEAEGSLDSSRDAADPLIVVEDALRKVFQVQDEQHRQNSLRYTQKLCSFLDATSQLKGVDLSRLNNEKKRKVFYLNLYHLMVMHAYLILGPPTSGWEWISYFNMISYQVCDDIFSLAELEHCIMRPNMSHPSQFVSKFVLPDKKHGDYIVPILEQPDIRLLFAMNCGSLSNPSSIPVFSVKQIENQLDKVTTEYLQNTCYVVQVEEKAIKLCLPRICSWYISDLVKGNGSRSEEERKSYGEKDYARAKSNPAKDVVWTLFPYLPVDVQNQCYSSDCSQSKNKSGADIHRTNDLFAILSFDDLKEKISFKYDSYEFSCRLLTLSS